MSKVVVRDIEKDPKNTILEIFDEFGGIDAMLSGKDKNQLGFLYHEDRRTCHNAFELHKLLVDMYEFVKPDLTIIDGKVAVVNGHYPLEKRLDKYLVPMNILIGGNDTVAVDAVGAKILGYTLNEVKHLEITHERGLRCADIKKNHSYL